MKATRVGLLSSQDSPSASEHHVRISNVRDVRAIMVSGKYDALVNCCESTPDNGYLGRIVAEALEGATIPFLSSRSAHFGYERQHLKMVCHYDNLLIPGYRLVMSGSTAEEASTGLNFPVSLRSCDPSDTGYVLARSVDELRAALSKWFSSVDDKVIVDEFPYPSSPKAFAQASIVVAAFGRRSSENVRCIDVTVGDAATNRTEHIEAARTAVMALLTSLCDGHGCLEAHFVIRSSDNSLGLFNVRVDAGRHIPEHWIPELISPPTSAAFQVTFDPALRGYHVTATRSMGVGEIVFEDEGHAFPIVTKGHVDANWSTKDQETFKRYAWPLDSEGHVYAVWQNDPRTWRPINHSCDPNLHFAAPHSLNVVTRRPVLRGEDLTLDYATFCDITMEPFECFCGALNCRKIIFPDDATLKVYGQHSWVRNRRNAHSASH